MNKLDFDIKYIEGPKFEDYVKKTVDSIMKSFKASRGRTRDEVYRTVRPGLAAEFFLMKKGFRENTHKYGDVISDMGIPIEVKTTRKSSGIDQYMENIRLKIKGYSPSYAIAIWTIKGSWYTFYGCIDMQTGQGMDINTLSQKFW